MKIQRTSFDTQRDMINLELNRVSGTLIDLGVLDNVRKMYDGLTDRVSAAFEKSTFMEVEKHELVKRMEAFGNKPPKYIFNHKYAALVDIPVFRPAGLKTGFHDYFREISRQNKEMSDVVDRLMVPLRKWGAELLSEPALLSQRPKFKPELIDLERNKKTIGKMFNDHDRTDKWPYGEAISNNREWNDIFEYIDETNGILNKKRLEELTQALTQVKDNFSLLFESIEEKPGLYKVNKGMMKAISEVTYAVGLEIEYHGILAHMYMGALKALADTLDAIK